jgi:2-isopropylmalate synthase
LYDTTLRDGTQREGLSLSVADKLAIARALDRFGVAYIEGGWPGSNPKDATFFREAANVEFAHARLAAFGSTRRANTAAANDANLRALLDAGTPVVTLVGKTSALHVERVLETTRAENLAMIADSVALCKRAGREVVYDAEHAFDGMALDPDYALATLAAAADAGADWIVLCDTNGGTLPDTVRDVVTAVRRRVAAPLGIHTHNDGAVAVANALAAVAAGCTQVQGTINGYGERCGNMDLIPLVANLQLKLGRCCVTDAQLHGLRDLSRHVAVIAGVPDDHHAAFVGRSAFAHKGGLHVAAVAKVEHSYQHIDPALVGNAGRVVVSELAGRSNVRAEAAALGLTLNGTETAVLERIKALEAAGFSFDGASGSFEMLVRRSDPSYTAPFEPLEFTVWVEQRGDRPVAAQATVKVRIDDCIVHTAGDGDGPVNALDRALRQALLPRYPALAGVQLTDYRVRIIDEQLGTAARPRVVIESACGGQRWTTVGCSENIIEASWLALLDSLELPLHRRL